MNDDTERIERLLRNAPRPTVPAQLPEKLKSEVQLFPQSARLVIAHSRKMEVAASSSLSILWRFFKSNRLNLGGLGVAWTVIVLCRITLPGAREMAAMAKLDRPSPEMFKALVEENQRLLFATFRSIRPEPSDAKIAPAQLRNEVKRKSDAG